MRRSNILETPNRIKEWRNRRRMSLAELGEVVGLSRSEISKLPSPVFAPASMAFLLRSCAA